MACSRAIVSLSGWNSGEIDVHVHAVLMIGSDENTALMGFLSSRFWLPAEGCRGYNGVCVLC